jgi:hypothetical protein
VRDSCSGSTTSGDEIGDPEAGRPQWFLLVVRSKQERKVAEGLQAKGYEVLLPMLRSYKTAWTWPHKLRRAMVRPDRDRLTGRVEVDETYLGGLEERVRGRQTERKALIVVAAQEDGPGIGRIRMRRIGPFASGPPGSSRRAGGFGSFN